MKSPQSQKKAREEFPDPIPAPDPPEAHKTQHDQGDNGAQEKGRNKEQNFYDNRDLEKAEQAAINKEFLASLKFESFEDLPEKEAEIVIEGLLRIGEKLGVTAGTKRFKTWLLLYIGYCVANGLPFLGFETKRQKVVLFDLELARNGIKRRLHLIQKTVCAGDFQNLKICSLRGKAKLFCTNFEQIKDRIKTEGFKVVIIDPVYKFLLGKEESSNGLVAEILDRLTVFCMEAQVAMIYVHHHSKGNQSTKDSLDRSSGAGAWSRDPDAVLDLVEHNNSTKEKRIFVAEITVRDFPAVENFVVRWDFPLLSRDKEGLDPAEVKQPPKMGRPKQDITGLVMSVFRVFDQNGGTTARQVAAFTLLNKRAVQRKIKDLVPVRLIKCAARADYQLSLAERADWEKFKAEQEADESQDPLEPQTK